MYSCKYPRYKQLIQDTKFEEQQPTQDANFVALHVYVLMLALPAIVDGARKSSQGGRWMWVGASLPILEIIREQCMSDVP